MRVVGIVALVSVLSAACALQPADGSGETTTAPGAQTSPASATVFGGSTAVLSAGSDDGTVVVNNTTTAGQTPPNPSSSQVTPGVPPQCNLPPCDPQPNPWDTGRPPVYLLGTKP
jgi:hypothetical protein